MSETKTKNLCTVPAADLTDSQYFIAEDGGELKRIPKAQVVLKKLENMLATDTENLAGGGEVTAQELLDALAEQVANKLLAKSQVVNNLLATVEGNPLDATQGKALKELIDTTNNNLCKAVYCSDLLETSESARFVQWNGDTLNTPFKAGLTDCQEGFAFCYGNRNDYMTVIAFAKNSNKMWGWSKASGNWVEYATKNDLQSFLIYKEFTTEERSWTPLTSYRISHTTPTGYRFLAYCHTRTNGWVGSVCPTPININEMSDLWTSVGSGTGTVTLGILFVKAA